MIWNYIPVTVGEVPPWLDASGAFDRFDDVIVCAVAADVAGAGVVWLDQRLPLALPASASGDSQQPLLLDGMEQPMPFSVKALPMAYTKMDDAAFRLLSLILSYNRNINDLLSKLCQSFSNFHLFAVDLAISIVFVFR